MSFLLVLLANTAWSAPAFVWSQLDAPYINVYFSPDGVSTTQLTTRGKNVLPVLDRQNDEIWISWVDKGAANGDRLNYARLTNTGSIRQQGSLPQTTGSLYAPSLMIEPSAKRVWIVWAEHIGRTEDLFVSYMNLTGASSSDWAPAIQITANDAFSANLPHIERAGSGEIEVSWMRTGPDEAGRASTTLNTSIFDRDSAPVRQIKPQAIRLENSNGGYPRIKYVTAKTDNTEYAIGWKNLTRNKSALMGAAISDSGVVTRIFDRR